MTQVTQQLRIERSLLYHFLSFTFSLPSIFDQGDGKVAKETEVMPLGVKGVKASKDGGIKESIVSTDKYADVIKLSSVISN